MLEFHQQCCDAEQYLQLAKLCGWHGQCYADLRPVGSQLWFAWPLWLGLPIQSTIYAGLLLLFLSCWLALKNFQFFCAQFSIRSSAAVQIFAFSTIIAVHLFVFWPLLFVSLADLPAGLLLLNGLWCWLLAYRAAAKPRCVLYALSGLLLGLAAWVRAFYLIPVSLAVAIYVFYCLFNRGQRWPALGLLLCFLPILTQYALTWQRYQQWSYLAPQKSDYWTQVHLRDRSVGYDTILPGIGLRHYPRCEIGKLGLIGAWENKDIASAWCLLSERLDFYARSDLRQAYIRASASPNLIKYSEQLDTQFIWQRTGFAVDKDAAIAPDGKKTAERLRVDDTEFKPHQEKRLFIATPAVAAGSYTASIWLWSPLAKSVELILASGHNNTLAKLDIVLQPEPVRYHLTAELAQGRHTLVVRAPSQNNSHMGFELGDYFYAWGGQLVAGTQPLEYHFGESPMEQRSWSTPLLLFNTVLLFGALLLLIVPGARSPALFMGSGLVLLCLAQSLVILPEQRFIAALQVWIWLNGLMLFALLLLRKCRSEQ